MNTLTSTTTSLNTFLFNNQLIVERVLERVSLENVLAYFNRNLCEHLVPSVEDVLVEVVDTVERHQTLSIVALVARIRNNRK